MLNTISRIITNSAPSFRFIVTVNGAPYGVFTECTLPVIEWDTQEITEGGLNTHTHKLIGRRKSATMTLKNGVGTGLLIAWYIQTMNGVFDVPLMGLRRAVTVILLNSLKIPVMTWHIDDAFPTRWTGPSLDTSQNNIAIQTLELTCGEITAVPGMGF